MFKTLRDLGKTPEKMDPSKQLPEFVLFGDSLTEWSFREHTQGFGLFMEKKYDGKAVMLNEAQLPEFVLFGASMVEWSFEEKTEGLGWFLRKTYADKVEVLNEGQAGYTSTRLKPDFNRIIDRATTHPSKPRTLLFTIFLGANDACIIGTQEYVPWPDFSANIRYFIETILTQDAMADTKIVLIGPPPINGNEAEFKEGMSKEDINDANAWKKEGPRYKTYMSKKRYAEGIMAIAKEYEETGRVVGLDFWGAIVDAKIEEDWKNGVEWKVVDEDEEEDLQRLPGCGLIGAKAFEKGWFTDGLHLDKKGYNVLSQKLMEVVLGKWPELAPEQL